MVAAMRMNVAGGGGDDNQQSKRESSKHPNSPKRRLLSAQNRPSSCYSARVNNLRMSIYHIMEEPEKCKKGPNKILSQLSASVILSMIILSILCFILETEPSLSDWPHELWKAVEVITTSTFTIEYLLRLWVSDVFGTSMVVWVSRPMNICDLLAILPMYAEFLLDNAAGLEALRVLRVIRLFKLGRYSVGVKVMSAALMNSMSALNILIFLFLIGVVIFSAAVYFTEKLSCPIFKEGTDMGIAQFMQYAEDCEVSSTGVSPTYGTCCHFECKGLNSTLHNLCKYPYLDRADLVQSRRLSPSSWEVSPMHEADFSSVPVTMWWAAVTMTTVGYGDYVPKYWVSKLVGSIAMVSGMLIIAMPFAIVGSRFGEAVADLADEDAGEAKTWNVAKAPAGIDGSPSAAMPKVKSDSSIEQKAIQTNKSTKTGMKQAELLAALHTDKFEMLQRHVQESLELKSHILKTTLLRDNLWTSIEHSMAAFTYEGIMSLQDELVLKPVEIEQTRMSGDPKYCEWSCYFFRRDGPLRRQCIWLTQDWPWFDRFVLLLIIANSIILALHDYYPRAEKPWQNVLDENTETPFICLFTLECLLKVIAVGFICHGNAYLHEAWNWLDFIVVVTGWLTLVAPSNDSDFTFLRTVRVLRPLRTLSTMPGMRSLVNTVFKSLPRLKDVLLMAVFLLMTFGILGIHFWGGAMHRLCRVTPQPLHFTPRLAELGESCRGWCFDNNSIVDIDLGDSRGISKINSSYVFEAFCRSSTSTPSLCELAYSRNEDYFVWPPDQSQDRFCGSRECGRYDPASVELGLTAEQFKQEILVPMGVPESQSSISPGVHTYCGNDFDSDLSYGPHIVNAQLKGVDMHHWEKLVFQEHFNWGITRYDHLGSALLVIFQCVTLEGWVDIMYMVQDAFSPSIFAFFYFVTLVIIGSFFLLNVTLAVVWDAFQSIQEGGSNDQPEAINEVSSANLASASQISEPSANDSTMSLMNQILSDRDPSMSMHVNRSQSQIAGLHAWLPRRDGRPMDVVLDEKHPWKPVEWARTLARNKAFSCFVMGAIGMNVMVLSMDKYPDPILHERVTDAFNLTFNIIFIIEFVVLHVAIGVADYWCDKALAFDGAIVLLSVVDMILVAAASGKGGGSGLTAMRAFRLLRVFKLAQRFPTMKALLSAIIDTLRAMRDFVFLLLLIIVVFALVGQSFFGGKFMFDPDTGEIITAADQSTTCPFDKSGNVADCVPRAHFDTFLWGCVTVFQILTGENWNAVMYDGIKAAGWLSSFYFIGVVVFGNFVILNLFLAILMMNFENEHSRIKEKQDEQKERAKALKEIRGAGKAKELHQSAALFKISGAMRNLKSSVTLGESARVSPEPSGDRQGQESVEAWALRGAEQQLEDQPAALPRSAEEVNDMSVENVSDTSGTRRQLESGSAAASSGQGQSDNPASSSASASPGLGDRLRKADASLPRARSPEDNDVPVGNSSKALEVPLKHEIKHDVSVASMDMTGLPNISLSRWSSLENITPEGMKHIWENSLFMFGPTSSVRLFCKRVDKWKHFSNTVLVAIIVSSALMMLQNPLHNPDAALPLFLFWADFVFTTIFTVEMVVKVIARGLLLGRHQPAYLTSAWNVVDGSIVTISVIDTLTSLFASGEDTGILSIMKIFRIARVLRPLRLISRNENLKVVVRTIYSSVPELRNLVLFSIIFFLIFGLLGVSLFKGSFYRCKDSGLESIWSSINVELEETPLCIPSVAISSVADNAKGMRFVSPQLDGACPSTEDIKWKRPTPTTPICEVHCEDNDHPFCQETRPWGYHVMRCRDCEQTFCATAERSLDDCKADCADHQIFCADQQSGCLDECISSCMCSSYCSPLSEDAALCVEQGGRWINFNQHFNNILDSWVSLFEISTTEGWVDMMYAAVDSRRPMKEPQRDSRPFLGCTIFVAFILVGTFFVLNLCVGVIISKYTEELEGKGRLFMTEPQRKWISWQKALYTRKKFFVQTNLHLLSPTRQHLVNIVTSSTFDSFIMSCIIVNTAIMGMQVHPTPDDPYNRVLEWGNMIFAMVFNIEAIMKLSAFHCNYFNDSWNCFDFLCVFAGNVILAIEATTGGNNSLGTTVSTFRIFRIARLFRLVRFLKGLNQLVRAFVLSVPKLCNVGLIMGLLIYLYAILGVSLFAKIGYLGTGMHSDQANFRNFPNAVSVLVRSMTGEAWNEIMHDLSKSRFFFESYTGVACYESFPVLASNFATLDLDNDGVVDLPAQCGTALGAYTFFITFTLSVTFVILNLFIAVILDGFEESQHNEVADIIYKCIEVWKTYDPECTMSLPLEKALDFIDQVVEEVCTKGCTDQGSKFQDESHKMVRYDNMYTGEKPEGIHSFPYYNLQYMHILALRVGEAPVFDVRFVVVVKAVLRRLVCQCVSNSGSIDFQGQKEGQRKDNLYDLKALELVLREPTNDSNKLLQEELTRLATLERLQRRANVDYFNMIPIRSSFRPPIQGQLALLPGASGDPASPSSGNAVTLGNDKRSIGRAPVFSELEMVEEVAAAKIQRRIKELLQKRRARGAEEAYSGPGSSAGSGERPLSSYGPLQRAAG